MKLRKFREKKSLKTSNQFVFRGVVPQSLILRREKMPEYKTADQVRGELEAINPGLVGKYKIEQLEDGVRLSRGETTIISRKGCSDGADRGLYEIYPMMMGMRFEDLFCARNNVAGNLQLEKAVEIAEVVYGFEQKLKEFGKKYF